ncbi:hypothetical protein [Erysipelothrix tonsillarum]|uniref:hypothetical protein n=1 Tax=Erysipelothrix tonsillarum TaxID=38402 RepID=UPI0003779651|nr:hypothetical protein [Erysipelothrix tonsillarum]
MKKKSRLIVFIVCIGVLMMMGLPNYFSQGKLQAIDESEVGSITYINDTMETTTEDETHILDSITALKSIEIKGNARQTSQPEFTYRMNIHFNDQSEMKIWVLDDKLVVDRKVYRISSDQAQQLIEHIKLQSN